MTTVKEVKIYTTATCRFCHAEKQFLDQHQIKYTEMHADQDQALAQELYDVSGQLGVPFTVITHDDSSQDKILGFDQPRLSAALGI